MIRRPSAPSFWLRWVCQKKIRASCHIVPNYESKKKERETKEGAYLENDNVLGYFQFFRNSAFFFLPCPSLLYTFNITHIFFFCTWDCSQGWWNLDFHLMVLDQHGHVPPIAQNKLGRKGKQLSKVEQLNMSTPNPRGFAKSVTSLEALGLHK
jgi:hypothetical protein